MNFNDYQRLAARTSGQTNPQARILMAALGLCGESGEFADQIKKIIYHAHPRSRAKLIEELGDVLWYIAEACSACQIELEDIAIENINKLEKRYPDGFSTERSINRTE